MIKENINKFLSNKYNKLFLVILIFAIILRLYYFNANSVLFWDEAEYLNKAKSLAFGTDYNSLWSPRKPIFLTLIMSILFKLGGTETAMHLLLALFSITTVSLTYFIGKKLYEEKTALIATTFMSVFWLDLFFMARILTDVPAATMAALTIFTYLKSRENNNYLYLLGGLIALSYLTRVTNIMLIGIVLVNMLIAERLNLFKNKKVYISGAIILAIIGLYFLWLSSSYENIAERLATLGAGVVPPFFSSLLAYTLNFPLYLTIPFLILFIIGIIPIITNLILGFDMLIKGKEKELNNSFLLISWILPFLLFYGIMLPNVEDRFLLPIFLPISLIIAKGALKVNEIIKKYHKDAGKIVIALFIISGIIFQLNQANISIEGKKDSYLPIKQAAIWMKENSAPNDLIISNSLPQNIYYSDRNTSYFNTKEEFENFIKNSKPKYMVASVFEQSYDWYYKYPEEHKDNIKPVNAILTEDKKPLVIIYQFTY